MTEKSPKEFKCFKCKSSLDHLISNSSSQTQISRSEFCISCNSDVKCCMNCSNYDINSYNSCLENQAEIVPDKEKANFCDWFKPKLGNTEENKNSKKIILKELDNLFK